MSQASRSKHESSELTSSVSFYSGFTLSMFEFTETIETLWKTTLEFMKLHPEHVAPDNSMGFLSDDKGGDYNHCHFWSNFEIGDL